MTAPWDADLAGLADVRTQGPGRAAGLRARSRAPTRRRSTDTCGPWRSPGTKAAEELARLAVDETGYGVYEHKIHKNRYNTGFVARWMLERRAVGVLWVDEEARVTAVGSPMGVIAAIIPVTNPTSTALFKSLAAVKSGNAIVHAPHPRAARCTLRAAEIMAEAAVRRRRSGGPDLLPDGSPPWPRRGS